MAGVKLSQLVCCVTEFFAFAGALLLVAGARLEVRAATLTVVNTNASGSGSLRRAILDANATNGLDTIVFQIPGTAVHTITLLSVLPPITDPVVIDGTTQAGYTNHPVIELNGASAGKNAGLRLLAGNSTVRGLAINRCDGDGIYIGGGGTNVIQGNFIGTDTTGTLALSNSGQGIWVISSTGNWIGGTNAGDGNLISSGNGTGVYLQSAGGNVVLGNLIGTTVAGNASLGNGNNGITIWNAAGNIIGGLVPSARNIISGNHASGIYLQGATGNSVLGNYIGADGSGGLAVSNVADGITLDGSAGNTIGGTNAGAANLISGNGKAGIFLQNNAVSNVIQGNCIGTDATGRAALGNTFAGVTISGASSNLIGGGVPAARNVISGNRQDGVFIKTNSSGNCVAGNFIGVDAAGTNALGNGYDGITIDSAAFNLVGTGNVISGNNYYGVWITNAAATGNVVQGNFVGTDVSGLAGIGNKLSGLRIESPGNTVGGPAVAARNVISGNGEDGVFIVGSLAAANVVQGSFIGTDVTGTKALKNIRAGVGISGAPGNTVGGAVTGAGNVISANGDAGIYLIGSGATGNQIQGNKLGTDVTGTLALGNAYEGIYCERAPTNTIGGTAPGTGNLISANQTRGVWLTNAPWNVLQGNLIGTKSDGVSALGNVFHNVECEAGANNNTVGGTAGAGNRIAFAQSVYAGVRIRNGSTNNAILGNAIFSNGALGIDLGTVGVTANDLCDTDAGANLLQNFPVLAQAVSGNGTGVRGTLNSRPGGSYRLQFFANPACDPSGNGEGQTYLGEGTVTTGPACTNSFVITLATVVPAGYVITATATDAANNTSEFSACVPVDSVPGLAMASSGSGQVKLTWTNAPSGFVLVQTESLSPPIQWSVVTNAPVLTNGQFVVAVAPTEGNRFYALSFE